MSHHVAAVLLVAACATDPNLSQDSDAITDETSAVASTFQTERAVKTAVEAEKGGCTATRISARFALTAAHCLGNDMMAQVGDLVGFYDSGPSNPSGRARIEQRHARTGVDVDACRFDQDCVDSDGHFADLALLRLSADNENDLEGPHATLAWSYPGSGIPGKAVGAGMHGGQVNLERTLRQSSDELDDAHDVNGEFWTDEAQTDEGDSGGPFYVGSRVVGVLAGAGSVGLDTYGRYSSVPYYINWLLTKIGYQWRGQPPLANTVFVGNPIESSSNGELACQYACEKTTTCEAYNWLESVKSCGLYSNVSPASTQTGWRGALKHGRTGSSGDAAGYVRADGIQAVVHAGIDGRVRELALTGPQWTVADIHGTAPLVTSRLTALRRADGTDALYYRGTGNRIIEIARTASGWKPFDLTTVTGGALAAGAPVAYVRSDGVTAVVYRASSGHIIELRLGSRGWIAADLSVASGSSVIATSDPSAFVRSDGQNSIVFRSGMHIWELYQSNGQPWDWGVPSQLTATAPPAAASRPVGYTHRGGINAIVYRSTGDQIIELFLVGTQWQWGVLASGAKGDPAAYTRNDGREAVLFRNAFGHIIEAANTTSWSTANLTTITGAGVPAGDPYVYHRRDGRNAVLFESAGHVNEVSWARGMPAWSALDLTTQSGETP
jgi:Trypsin